MRYFARQVICFSFILLIPLILYFYFDPFNVLYRIPDRSNFYVATNRDYFSTEAYLRNQKKIRYTSFIFGSSRTLAFKPLLWKRYLGKDDIPFVFDASGETIYGIYKKIKLLDSLHARMVNVLVIICRDVSFASAGNSKGILYLKHPVLSGESKIDFQLEFVRAYFDPQFLFSFYMYKILNRYKPFMRGYIVESRIGLDTITNGYSLDKAESEIASDPGTYFKTAAFYPRTGEQTDTINRINAGQLFMLKEIKRILEKNRSSYKIVLSPLYEQIKFKKEDLLKLKDLFGKNLYDFSGKNRFTDSITNYYNDTYHYRPVLGNKLFNIIYKQ